MVKKKIFLVAYNSTTGGGRSLLDSLMYEINISNNYIIHPNSLIYKTSSFKKIIYLFFLKFIPIDFEDTIVLNLTNYPISFYNKSISKEICLIHNSLIFENIDLSYFKNLKFFFRVLIQKCFFKISFFLSNKSKLQLVVQTNYMNQLILKKININTKIIKLHKPPNYYLKEKKITLPKKKYWLISGNNLIHKNLEYLKNIIKGLDKNFVFVTTITDFNNFLNSHNEDIRPTLSKKIINYGYLEADQYKYLILNCQGIINLSKTESLCISFLESIYYKKYIICLDFTYSKSFFNNKIKLFDVLDPNLIIETLNGSNFRELYHDFPLSSILDSLLDHYSK